MWDSSLCIHVGFCISNGDGVFEPGRRPWVEMDRAATDTIIAAIETCPSGALRYEYLDGRQGEIPDSPTTVVPWPNGPLTIRGELDVRDRRGTSFLVGPRTALCRCGASGNQPFCDLSHKQSGFKDHPRADTAGRSHAECPGDISQTPLEP